MTPPVDPRTPAAAEPAPDDLDRIGRLAQPAVSVLSQVGPAEAARFWELYLAAFGPLRTLAANKQVMSEADFLEEMSNERIDKYVAWSTDGNPIGLSTLTSDLDAAWWVSPQYYAQRYPDHHARGAILYLGYALVHPAHRRGGALTAMLGAMGERANAQRAVVGYDICKFNHDTMDFANAVEAIMRDRWQVATSRVDAQVFYTMDFATT